MKLNEVEKLLHQAITATELFFDKIAELPPTEALGHFYRLKVAREELDSRMKALTALYQRQQYHTIPEIMIRNNIRTFTDDQLGRRFGLSRRTSAKIVDKPRAFDWLRSEGHGSLITETVNAQTLGAFAGNYSEETGFDLPEDIFEVKETVYATVTKAGKKKA
jgi:hypothetical protein